MNDLERPYGLLLLCIYYKERGLSPQQLLSPIDISRVYAPEVESAPVIVLNDKTTLTVFGVSLSQLTNMIDVAMRERLEKK